MTFLILLIAVLAFMVLALAYSLGKHKITTREEMNALHELLTEKKDGSPVSKQRAYLDSVRYSFEGFPLAEDEEFMQLVVKRNALWLEISKAAIRVDIAELEERVGAPSAFLVAMQEQEGAHGTETPRD